MCTNLEKENLVSIQENKMPKYHSDVIYIEPNCRCRIIITWESSNGKTEITPTVTIPKKKGWIKSRCYDKSFMLSTSNSAAHPVCEIEVFSELGYMDISYHCKVNDYRNISYWASSKILQWAGMKKESLTPTKNRYYCADEFGDLCGYVFTVEWRHNHN